MDKYSYNFTSSGSLNFQASQGNFVFAYKKTKKQNKTQSELYKGVGTSLTIANQ